MQIADVQIDPRLVPEGSIARVLNGPRGDEYQDLPSIITPDGKVISRWVPTPAERAAILAGEDIFLTVCTFNYPLQPVLVTVGPIDWTSQDPLDAL